MAAEPVKELKEVVTTPAESVDAAGGKVFTFFTPLTQQVIQGTQAKVITLTKSTTAKLKRVKEMRLRKVTFGGGYEDAK